MQYLIEQVIVLHFVVNDEWDEVGQDEMRCFLELSA
eukprot:CAMPEP_0197044532 /NCGR_PEP_ID=MMETSP1384-20130603/20563_1 /TAXON_ID=29189 /ORGANISM="Ammonia sp." /LENGTH=35 /DNA_ID= /DNA_START= /DNA_END= /DNA_ORIENTATION=